MNNFIEDYRCNKSAGLLAVLLIWSYRIGHWSFVGKTRGNRLFWLPYAAISVPHRCLQVLYGCSIPFSCVIGRRVRFVHGFYGVFISGMAQIHDDVAVLHHVTVGSNIGSSRELGAPTVGRGVFIGAGAKIIGPVRVGENARIGANAVVVGDVRPHAVVYVEASVNG